MLAALLVVAAVMVGFILYSLFSGPDYQNDDYQPPPPGPTAPLPDIRYSEIDQILNENPLYAQTLPVPVRCELSNPEINLDTATDAAVHAHLDEVMACLMRVWEPPFRGTGRFEAHRPVVNVYQDQIATPCGAQNDPSAFYCMVNQQIYLSRQYGETHPNLAALPKPRVVDAVMAHEFGHAMQGR
ncbi:MAG: neutral zinc metallopeptidase, partial [Propionibacteriaceae bacterium]|nr:neutral zinc metallopeptidase [Propionibacteriaceae bacterium]